MFFHISRVYDFIRAQDKKYLSISFAESQKCFVARLDALVNPPVEEDERGIEHPVFVVAEFAVGLHVDDQSSGGLHDCLPGGGVPFGAFGKFRADVDQSPGHHALLGGGSQRHQLHVVVQAAEVVDVAQFPLDDVETADGHPQFVVRHRAVVFQGKGLAVPCHAGGDVAASPQDFIVEDVVDDAEYGFPVFEQSDVDAEPPVVGDELFRSVQRVDAPDVFPVLAGGKGRYVRLLADNRDVRVQPAERGHEEGAGGLVRLGDGRAVVLHLDMEVARIVNVEDQFAGLFYNIL